jgi:cytochrome bd-type quinol oxidase subunit 1
MKLLATRVLLLLQLLSLHRHTQFATLTHCHWRCDFLSVLLLQVQNFPSHSAQEALVSFVLALLFSPYTLAFGTVVHSAGYKSWTVCTILQLHIASVAATASTSTLHRMFMYTLMALLICSDWLLHRSTGQQTGS